jgi:hypothetical protein
MSFIQSVLNRLFAPVFELLDSLPPQALNRLFAPF